MTGWLTFIHTCGGEIQSITLIPTESCEMDSMDSCHSKAKKMDSCQNSKENSCCEAESTSHDGCCQDIHLYLEFEQPIIFSPFDLLPKNFAIFAPIASPFGEVVFALIHETPLQEKTRPPPLSVPLYIQFQRLTFYA